MNLYLFIVFFLNGMFVINFVINGVFELFFVIFEVNVYVYICSIKFLKVYFFRLMKFYVYVLKNL